MEDISELLLGPQRFSGSTAVTVVLAVIALLAAGVLMSYLVYCYVQEVRFRKRVERLLNPLHARDVAPATMPAPKPISEPKRLPQMAPGMLPVPRMENGMKVRRRSRHLHPWKQNRFRAESATPH